MDIKSFYLFQVLCVVLQSILLLAPTIFSQSPFIVMFYPHILLMVFSLIVGIASSRTEIGDTSLGLFVARAVLLQVALFIGFFITVYSLIGKNIDHFTYSILFIERIFFGPIVIVVLLVLLVVQIRILDQRKKVKAQ